jgi:hypothetical protein
MPDRAESKQPKPARCTAIGKIPAGAFVLFENRAWDADYNWVEEHNRNPDAVPDVILKVMSKKL